VIYLIDVNVLVSLVDPGHTMHHAAHRWFQAVGAAGWATCPITENGLLRILGSSRYPNSPGSPAAVMPILHSLRQHSGHHFWPDALSLASSDLIDSSRLLDSAQVTDSYLLALAVAHQACLATFDRRLVTSAVHGGSAAFSPISESFCIPEPSV